MNPGKSAPTWHTAGKEPTVPIFVSDVIGDLADLVDGHVAGFAVQISLVKGSDWIDPADLADAPAAIVQVDGDNGASVKRFQQLAAAVPVPLIAAAVEPPLALVRSLVRSGAHDVIPLPLTKEDLDATLSPIREDLVRRKAKTSTSPGRLITAIKSLGGVGATSVMTQLAMRFAAMESGSGRETCLIDLDVQFGDVAFQLGSQNKLTLLDLIDAGNRLDSDLLRSTTAIHRSGLNFVSAPKDMLPIESMNGDQILQIVDLAKRNYSTLFVDLPTNWTNWSLSLVARSDLVLLFTELSVAGLNGARRQLDLLSSQDLGNLDVRVIVNRFVKTQLRNFREQDIQRALGRDVSFYVANDFPLMRSAIDRGLPLGELKRKSALGSDIDAIAATLAVALEAKS
jgi:pilus assembly protein CpaE